MRDHEEPFTSLHNAEGSSVKYAPSAAIPPRSKGFDEAPECLAALCSENPGGVFPNDPLRSGFDGESDESERKSASLVFQSSSVGSSDRERLTGCSSHEDAGSFVEVICGELR